MKKPSIPNAFPPNRNLMSALKQNIDIVTGRSGSKTDLSGLRSMTISDPPTQAEVDKLRLELINLVTRLEE